MSTRKAPPARCLALFERLSGYIDAELTPRQRRAVEVHCRDCSRCQAVVASLRRTVTLCRRSRGTPMPPQARARARRRISKLFENLPKTALLTTGLVALLGVFAVAALAEVNLSESNIFPESITSTADGTVYVGSLVQPFISRALPGQTTATPWIHFTGDQIGSTLGVLADSASKTLWACVVEHPANTPQPPPPNARHTSLRSFDLATGAFQHRWPLPGEFNSCNDMTMMADRTVYISDPSNGRVLRLKSGAAAIDVFIKDDRLAGVDGITVMNGALYVNSISSGKVYRVPVEAHGEPGALVEIALSHPLQGPDGMRALGTRMYVAESRAMQVSMMDFNGDSATVTTIKGGYKNPTAVSPTGDTLWIGESKQNYWRDPALVNQNPNPFVIYSMPLPR